MSNERLIGATLICHPISNYDIFGKYDRKERIKVRLLVSKEVCKWFEVKFAVIIDGNHRLQYMLQELYKNTLSVVNCLKDEDFLSRFLDYFEIVEKKKI